MPMMSSDHGKARADPIAPRLLRESVIAIGASTGGTEAIKAVLSGLPAQMPPIVIVQHMAEGFIATFARRLDALCSLRVLVAQGGESLTPGTAWLAPGNAHLMLRRSVSGFQTRLDHSAPVNGHRPSVDVLFNSLARLAGRNALAILLTGMGRDGAQGLLRLRQAGAWTLAQDEASSVVYGMPREAAEIGAVREVSPLGQIQGRLLARLQAP